MSVEQQHMPELKTFLPNGEQHVLSQEEYIRTLETWNQLLQREVENLRQQPRSRGATAMDMPAADPSALEYTAKLIQSYSSAEQVILTLQEYIASRFPVLDSGIFLIDPASSKLQPAVDSTLSSLRSIKINLEEEGIIDWTIRRRKTVVIPSFSGSIGEQRPNFILVPLFLRGTAVGIFIAQTTAEASEFHRDDLAALTILAESAAIAIDNIRSATEITRMNMRLNSMNKQMLHSAKLASIGELAGSVAHEINNPLQILLGHIQLVENGVGDSTRRLHIIKEQVYRISDITRRLLDFARATPAEIQPEPINLGTLIDDVFLFVGSQLRRDGIEVEKICEEPAPVVVGSKAQIEQVLLNIIINARDAMPDGGRITIGIFSESNHAYLTVADIGVGISEEDIGHVFDSFYSTKPRGKGTGLGLSIAREIIKQHNGTISVASELQKGTTFKIILPLIAITN